MQGDFFEIELRERAVAEIEQAFEYYSVINTNVAYFFEEELDNSFQILQKNPYFRTRVDDYRALPLNKFPYIIIFTIVEDENIVDILSLFHTSQDPQKYPK
jgi:plasmid stabilization system protein ParE